MDLTTALLFVHFGLFVFFVGLSFKTQRKIFNLFAIAVLISLSLNYLLSNTTLLIISVLFILFLLYDTFRGEVSK